MEKRKYTFYDRYQKVKYAILLQRSWKFLIFLIIRNIICLISSIREIIQYYFVV